jgi:hypothetical protein
MGLIDICGGCFAWAVRARDPRPLYGEGYDVQGWESGVQRHARRSPWLWRDN